MKNEHPACALLPSLRIYVHPRSPERRLWTPLSNYEAALVRIWAPSSLNRTSSFSTRSPSTLPWSIHQSIRFHSNKSGVHHHFFVIWYRVFWWTMRQEKNFSGPKKNSLNTLKNLLFSDINNVFSHQTFPLYSCECDPKRGIILWKKL